MRDRERELEEERWFEEERESFPQFWYVIHCSFAFFPTNPSPPDQIQVLYLGFLMNCLQYNQLPLPK